MHMCTLRVRKHFLIQILDMYFRCPFRFLQKNPFVHMCTFLLPGWQPIPLLHKRSFEAALLSPSPASSHTSCSSFNPVPVVMYFACN